jgi:uncharacterized protein YjeT (DUF2065 family)
MLGQPVISGVEDCKKMKLFLCLVGLVLIVEGLPYFAFPDKMKRWIAMVQDLPNAHLRIVGFLAMAMGLLLTYFFRE